MDIQNIINKVKQFSDSNYTDDMITRLAMEGKTIACRGLENGEEDVVYADDMLVFYVLSQIDLMNGDLSMYNNHMMMYNNALMEYRRIIAQDGEPQDGLTFRNIYL